MVTKAEVFRLRTEYEAAKRGKDLADRDTEEAEQKLTALQLGSNEALAVEVSKAVAKVQSSYESEPGLKANRRSLPR